MPKPNCENLSNSASAKPSYFFYFFFYLFSFFSFLLATSSCRFFLFFFLVFFFSSHKNTEFTVFNIWKASEAPLEKVQKRTVRSPILHRGKDGPSSRHCCRSCG